MGAPYPPVLPEAFANSAGGGFITNPIPKTTATPGAASYDEGFPPLTMTPEIAGGVPPFGQDFNGILFALSSHEFFQQAGQLYLFDASTATALGGYAVQSILASTDGKTIWYNTVANNMNDPDGGGNTGWVPLFGYGLIPIAVTGGTDTLSNTEAARSILVFTGALASNQIIVLPNNVQQWLVVNATSGAHTLTTKTAAGTGVVIPQGGFAQASGIFGDGTNIYLTSISTAGLAPIASPTFTGTPAAPTPPTADNSTRLATTAYVKANVAGLAPLASPTLTGIPRGPTAAVGAATTQLATTAFVNPGQVLAASGYVKLPGGLIIQWGTIGPVSSFGQPVDVNISFPTPFPHLCMVVVPVTNKSEASGGAAAFGSNFATNITTLGATVTIDQFGPGGSGSASGKWFAIGF